MWEPQMTNWSTPLEQIACCYIWPQHVFFLPLKSDCIATFSINLKRFHLMPSSVSSFLRILHQDAAMSPEGMTCTPSAPPGPPVRSTPVLTATAVWAPPTAGELQSYSPARSLVFNLFFFFFSLKPGTFFLKNLFWNRVLLTIWACINYIYTSFFLLTDCKNWACLDAHRAN